MGGSRKIYAVMNNVKNIAEGKDVPLQFFQKHVYDALKSLWQLDDTTFEGYGRVYKNTNDKGYVPEVLVSSAAANNTTYKPVVFDKTALSAMFFLTVGDKAEIKLGNETVSVSLIVICNLALIKQSVPHRADEEVMKDVLRVLTVNVPGNFKVKDSETGFRNVFREFSGLINKDGEVFEDRHPLFCFRYNMTLIYNTRNCQTLSIN